jgi:penicillin-binding protein 1A
MKPEEKISQMALVTLGKDGAVLAMLGGRDYRESQFNRVTQALRQPGSSFKPFVFLAAMESGYSPDDLIEDAPFREGSYKPENYEGKYYGDISLTQALAFSLNTATIRLLKQVGVSKLADVTQRLGFTRKFKAELATGLGASEASLMEMVNAYAVIANDGYAVWPYGVLSIEDSAGNILYQREEAGYARLFSGQDIQRPRQHAGAGGRAGNGAGRTAFARPCRR